MIGKAIAVVMLVVTVPLVICTVVVTIATVTGKARPRR